MTLSPRRSPKQVAVYGAYGHTGRFVVAELVRRGWSPILSGRDAERLQSLGKHVPGALVRAASVGDADSLDAMLDGVQAVVNCAGPFLDTASPVIEAALRAGVHYLDLTAEQESARQAFERYGEASRSAGVAILPAVAFYGGLADLLATAAAGEWEYVDEVEVGVALDRWHPTDGTRRTGKRNVFPRRVVTGGHLTDLPTPSPSRRWSFPEPFGDQDVVATPLSEVIAIHSHLRAEEVHTFINRAPLRDLADPATPPPTATDEAGRSAQVFVVEVVVHREEEARRAMARGRDIYAITAPLAGEALDRVA
ncbi:MAG TPA: saccharopine dehydrogenase NADP-binding domain-containing protein, partial [Rhodothermales bacterium]|nr:saccharopine dehydrogenase NADP-binding domain-containing protein [Rhodothermales bacterium]